MGRVALRGASTSLLNVQTDPRMGSIGTAPAIGGEVPTEDAQENARSLEYGWRVLSSYPVGENGGNVWIITEADRSSTCLLLPSEY